ncbi:MAG: GNAT family protein [Flavobacteriales bacterium]|nr:GNAT family protein [Flavobacteriales bacterium]
MLRLASQTFLLETERLWLRPILPSTFKEASGNLDPNLLLEFYGVSEEKEMMRELQMADEGSEMYGKSLLLFHLVRKSDDCVLGSCGYHTVYTKHFRAELGYILNKEEDMKQGYMTEALLEVLRYGVNEMGLERIEAYIDANNIASLSLLKKFGFQFEGVARKHYRANDKNEDSDLYSLTDNDWRKIFEGSK